MFLSHPRVHHIMDFMPSSMQSALFPVHFFYTLHTIPTNLFLPSSLRQTICQQLSSPSSIGWWLHVASCPADVPQCESQWCPFIFCTLDRLQAAVWSSQGNPLIRLPSVSVSSWSPSKSSKAWPFYRISSLPQIYSVCRHFTSVNFTRVDICHWHLLIRRMVSMRSSLVMVLQVTAL